MIDGQSLNGWSHPSVLELMSSHQSNDPEQIVRSIARAVVVDAKAKGWSGPPFNPEILASILGIRCLPSTSLLSEEAQLTPQPDKSLLIEYNPNRPPGRINYSICHEIVHTFFGNLYEKTHQRSKSLKYANADDEVESLCQIGAAELLLPHIEFDHDFGSLGVSLSSAQRLKSMYCASTEAVLRRMMYFTETPIAATFFNRRNSPAEKQNKVRSRPKEKMRILYTVKSSSFPVFLPPHKSVPDSSCVSLASDTEEIVSAIEEWEINGFGAWKVEAIRLTSAGQMDDSSPSVVALIVAK